MVQRGVLWTLWLHENACRQMEARSYLYTITQYASCPRPVGHERSDEEAETQLRVTVFLFVRPRFHPITSSSLPHLATRVLLLKLPAVAHALA